MTRRLITGCVSAVTTAAALALVAGCGGDARFPRGVLSAARPASRKRGASSPLRQGTVSGVRPGKTVVAPSAEGSNPIGRGVSEETKRARADLDGQKRTGSALMALATGQFKGMSVPEPEVEVSATEHEPIPPAPKRREVASIEEARERALADLASENAHLRFVAAREAGRLRIAEAVPLLAKLVRTAGAARLPAIVALGRIGGERAAKVLTKALGREADTQARLAVVRALGATGARGALRPLERELLGGKAMVQIEAAAALGALGRREAVPSLEKALARTDFVPAARVAAAAALARLGETGGLAALERAAAERSPTLQVIALRGMAALAQGPAPPEGREADALRARAVRSVASAVGSEYEEVWSEAIRFLARTRPHGAVPVLDALEHGDAEAALRARVARAAWGGPGAHEALAGAMQSPRHLLRAAACGIMGSLGDPRSVEYLAAALSDPSATVRVSAVWALGAVGGDGAVKALERASAAEEVPLKNAATRALAAMRARGEATARRPRPTPGEPAKEEGGRAELILEQIVAGAGGDLFCMIRGPGGERRLVGRGEEAPSGYRVEAIVPDGVGGGKVILSRGEGTLELRLDAAHSRRRSRRD